jgi:Protein of unknown function (DUF3563)
VIVLSLFCKSVRDILDRCGSWPPALSDQLSKVRRNLLPTDGELERKYLDESVDRYDLEMRMRDLDRTPARDRLMNPFR